MKKMLETIQKKYQFIKKLNFIKTLYYSLRFGGFIFVGKGKIFIEGNGKIEFTSRTSCLFVGVYTTVDTPTVITIQNNSKLIVGYRSMIHRGTKVVVHNGGVLTLGNSTYINENARIHCKKKITIGNNCAIAWNTNLIDTDLHTIHFTNKQTNKQTNNDAAITIGNHVWIGANTTILKGSTINNNCIIGANSIVRGTLNSRHIYSGNPAVDKGTFEYWEI